MIRPPDPGKGVPEALVIFDLDGTLAASRDVMIDAFRAAYRQVVGPGTAPVAEFLAMLGAPFPRILQALGLPQAMDSPFRAVASARVDSVRTVPAAVAACRSLADTGVATAVHTGKDRARAEDLLRRLGIDRAIDGLVAGDDSPAGKPAPDGVLALCERLGVPPRRTIMVGDSVFDMQAGRAAGATTVACLWGLGTATGLRAAGAEHVVRAPDDLPRVLHHCLGRAWSGPSRRRDCLLLDLSGVISPMDHPRRLQELARCCSASPDEIHRQVWVSGFDNDMDAGEVPLERIMHVFRSRLGFHGTLQDLEQAWLAAFTPDPDVLDLVDDVSPEIVTAVLSDNGPLLASGMPSLLPRTWTRFHPVILSCDIGVRKPDARAFQAALRRLGTAPQDVLFVDDLPENVAAARGQGMRAEVFRGVDQLRQVLAAEGMLATDGLWQPTWASS